MHKVSRRDTALAVALQLRYLGDPADMLDKVMEIYKSEGIKPTLSRVMEDANSGKIRRHYDSVVVTIDNRDVVGFGAAANDLCNHQH
jgi:hypothetical protein